MMNHELKTDSEVFQALIDGAKTYELRKDDRGFAVGDTLTLRETKHTGAEMAAGAPLEYTGRTTGRVVTHILRGPIYGLTDGWVILSVKEASPLTRSPGEPFVFATADQTMADFTKGASTPT